MDAEPTILFSLDDHGVGTMTLNRPGKLNAFTREMILLWGQVLNDAAANPDVRVIVLTGAGRAFCAGGDAEEMRDEKGSLSFKKYLWEEIQSIPRTLDVIDKPVIASLNGTARGAGLDMALMCDLRIAAASATFAESYINMGLIAGDGGTYYLPRLIGIPRALEMFWTGRVVGADEAVQIGLINRVVPDDKLAEATTELARQLAGQPQEAMRYFKRCIYQGATMGLQAHLDMVSSHMAVLKVTPDHQERVAAFLNRVRG